MALSFSSHHPEPIIHSQLQHNPTLSYSTPRRYSSLAAEQDVTPQKILPGMNKDQVVLSSDFEHISPSPSQVILDLPSWTPLGKSEGVEGTLASEADEPEASTVVSNTGVRTTSNGPSSESPRLGGASGSSSPLSNHPKRDNNKKAQFAGVVIVSKRRPSTQSSASKPLSAPRRSVISDSSALSLVSALKRTFDANKHVDLSPPPNIPLRLGRLHSAINRDNDVSPAPQTDIETGSTETEDERPQLSNRLLAPTPKKHLARARGVLSETNSDDVALSTRETSVRPERPVKRLKSIQYDPYAALIDASLGTVEAPVTWGAEQDVFTKMTTTVGQSKLPEVPNHDVAMDFDRVTYTRKPAGPGSAVPACVARNPWRGPMPTLPQKAFLSLRVPRGDRFKERLVTMFGENATVRMDKGARPKPAAIDLFPSPDDLDREPSPNHRESSASESAPSTVPGGQISTIPSTQLTSQSPELPPTIFHFSPDGPPEEPSEDGLVTSKATFETTEEQINGWVAALQRLVKGKVRIHDEDLEMLSVVLAEIESVRASLDMRGQMTAELRTSLVQLSELQDIPFGDMNNLRQRAEMLLSWPSSPLV